MSFDFTKNIDFFECRECDRVGRISRKLCPHCQGLGFGLKKEGCFYYWGKVLSVLTLWVDKVEEGGKKVIQAILWLTVVLGAVSLLLVIFSLIQTPGIMMEDLLFWRQENILMFWVWVGVLGACYLHYWKERSEEIRVFVYEKTEVPASGFWKFLEYWTGKSKNKKDISKTFGSSSWKVIKTAWQSALEENHSVLLPAHLLAASMGEPETRFVLARLGVAPQALERRIQSAYKRISTGSRSPVLSLEALKVFFYAYLEAEALKKREVEITDLLVALTVGETHAADILYDLKIETKKMRHVSSWLAINKQLSLRRKNFQYKARFKPKSGLDRAMTAVATPFLNSFSEDLTALAREGSLSPCIARNKELEEIVRIMEGGRQNALLVGQTGVGVSTIVNGLAWRMVEEDVPSSLQDKRLVGLKLSSLVAGAKERGEIEERLKHLVWEVVQAGNIILFIDHLHNLVGMRSGEGSSFDISVQLIDYLSKHLFMAIGATTPLQYRRIIEKSGLPSVFTRVEIDEMDRDQAIRVLEAKAGAMEHKNRVYFTYDSIAKTVDLSVRFIHDDFLPQKAVNLLQETAIFVQSIKGEGHIVRDEDVAYIVSEKIDMPLTQVTQSEKDKLLNLEGLIHERIVGQEEAVVAVARALRRSRAELRDIQKPIANFLFLGPTGVGKTELAKTVAQVYFGHEKDMVRIDMSEYQQKSAIDRLIGSLDLEQGGLLSEGVRRNPFSVVLLDELEKAHPDILNLFLQVMDEGYFTDSIGRKIDFSNCVIIATSNAGTSYIQESLKQGMPIEEIRKHLINEELSRYYRPEFLNRFDSIVVFKPLSFEEIKKITRLLLKKVIKRLKVKGIKLKVTDAAVEDLAREGFDPLFGARPLKRAIQNQVDNALAKTLLQGDISRRDQVVLDKGGRITIKKARSYA